MACKHSGLSEQSYATAVAEHYNASVPLAARHIDFHGTRDVYADARANAQLVARFLNGTTRMPVELEESLVLALPRPYRDELQRELAARLGLLAAPLPTDDHARDLVSVADLMKETGEFLLAIAPALADGKIDSADLPHALRALSEVRDVLGRCVSIECKLVSVIANAAEASKVVRMRGAA